MKLKYLILSAGLLFLPGCFLFSHEKKIEPPTLHIAVSDIFCTNTAAPCLLETAARSYSQTAEQMFLHGLTLQFDYFENPIEFKTAILSGKYNASICAPWRVMRLNREAQTDFQRVADLLDPTENRWLTGIVIVPVDSPIESIEALNGKRIALGPTDAYETYQAAKKLFEDEEINPSEYIPLGNSKKEIEALLNGSVDAAVISDYILSTEASPKFADPDDFRILAHTEMIPHTSFLLDLNKIGDDEERHIKKALLTLSGTNAPATLQGGGFVDPWPWNPQELEEPQ